MGYGGSEVVIDLVWFYYEGVEGWLILDDFGDWGEYFGSSEIGFGNWGVI